MTLFLLALGLSMDSLAAALSQGAAARPRPTATGALRVGIAFGAAQGLMPLVGWALGLTFASVLHDVDHWIAFVLLSAIGVHMIYDARGATDSTAGVHAPLASGLALYAAAVATSIDAGVAGVTLTLMDLPVLVSCAVIGIVTLVCAATGVLIGSMAGALAGRRAQVLGGFVLIGIGTRILIEHVFFGG